MFSGDREPTITCIYEHVNMLYRVEKFLFKGLEIKSYFVKVSIKIYKWVCGRSYEFGFFILRRSEFILKLVTNGEGSLRSFLFLKKWVVIKR